MTVSSSPVDQYARVRALIAERHRLQHTPASHLEQQQVDLRAQQQQLFAELARARQAVHMGHQDATIEAERLLRQRQLEDAALALRQRLFAVEAEITNAGGPITKQREQLDAEIARELQQLVRQRVLALAHQVNVCARLHRELRVAQVLASQEARNRVELGVAMPAFATSPDDIGHVVYWWARMRELGFALPALVASDVPLPAPRPVPVPSPSADPWLGRGHRMPLDSAGNQVDDTSAGATP
jgi:hypothetical protein